MSRPAEAPPDLLRIEKGHAEPEELAALTVVLCARLVLSQADDRVVPACRGDGRAAARGAHRLLVGLLDVRLSDRPGGVAERESRARNMMNAVLVRFRGPMGADVSVASGLLRSRARPLPVAQVQVRRADSDMPHGAPP